MSSSLNISDVIAHVRNIVNHVRCTVCDKRGGDRIRFVCGHTSCQDCLINTEGCLLCLTPPASLVNPKLDEPLSQRVQNTCDLLNVCQDTFNIDVYRKLRVSEQQKAEKELFPKCIQAPEKYYNKRKSVRTVENKENTYNYIYPGEHIAHSDLFMMKKYDNDIQQWLDDSDKIPRKALADLSVNKQNINKKTKSYQKLSNDSCVDLASFITKPRKRPHSTTSFPLINKKKKFISKKLKKSEQESPFVTNNYTTVYEHTNNEERGIVLDNEPILIEDSQSQVTHKDKVAVPAGDKEEPDFISLKSDSSLDFEFLYSVNTEKKLFNGVERKKTVKAVPFYKKSPLVEHCFHSKGDHKPKSKLDHDSNGVSITIKNNTFITTINISKYEQVVPHKKNVSVQTDLNYIEKIREKKERFESITKENNVLLLADTRKNKVLQDSLNLPQTQSVENLHELNNISKKGVTINESDSDESLFEGSSLQVTAEVHRSCEPKDYKGVLREINTSKLSSKSRSKVRCYTPDSNNSSDKENCDPNKYKKQKNGKKNKYSKK